MEITNHERVCKAMELLKSGLGPFVVAEFKCASKDRAAAEASRLMSELRDHRNKWAHQESFSSDDAYGALHSAGRLLTAVSAPQANEIEKMKKNWNSCVCASTSRCGKKSARAPGRRSRVRA